MDEARRYHFPFHAYYPSASITSPETEAVQPFESDVERQQPSPFGGPPKSLSPPPQRGDLYEDDLHNDRRISQSIDPRKSFSPSAAASDGTNGYTEKKERHLPGVLGDQAATPGLQSAWGEEADKEVYRVAGYPSGTPSGHSATSQPPGSPMSKKRMCGLPLKWFIIIAVLIACIIIGLAVGLGVGLGSHHSSAPGRPSPTSSPSGTPGVTVDPAYDIGGVLNPAYYSTDRAFNGSGIALATSTPSDSSGYGNINLYFQYYDGTVRWIRLLDDGTWQGGTVAEIITADARNGTPIAAVAYAMNETSSWHLFFIDKDDMVRQKTFTNVTNLWEDGPVNNLNITASSAPMVGLQACWFGNLYGDSEYTRSPQFDNPNISTTAGSDSTVGMHLFVGVSETSFQQYGWLHGETQWTIQDHWPNMNAQAGVGCYSWGPGTVTYVFMVDLENSLNIYWKDTNASLPSTATHPVNKWVNSSIAINDLHPSSSVGFTNFFYCQLADETINGYNISFDAENTAFVPGDNFQIDGLPGVPGTHLSVTSMSNPSGGASILAFYQSHGDDIIAYSRDKYAGQWTGSLVPIPG